MSEYDYCFKLMVEELLNLCNRDVVSVLYKYHCYIVPEWTSPALRFPLNLTEEDLPEALQMKNEPKEET